MLTHQVLLLLLLTQLHASDTTKDAPPATPHVLLVVADDYGYNDVGYQQNAPTSANPSALQTTAHPLLTPTLDRLAAEGTKLTNYYVQPLCSPTRGTILTGRYPSHTGIGPNVIKPTHPYAMPKNETLIAEKFKQAGYSAHIVGKWHLGLCDQRYTPTFRGFDSFTGYLLGAEDYLYHNRSDNGYHGLDLRNTTGSCFSGANHLPPATRDAEGTYSTNVWTAAVARIIGERASQSNPKPLFIYMPFQSVHGPLQAPATDIAKYPSTMEKSRRTYAGMVSALDSAVATIESLYKEAGLWNDTVLVFTTDNGGPLGSANNFPLRGHKATAWEGGIRGVGFVRGVHNNDPAWDAFTVPAGTTNTLMHSTDWLPTLSSVAGYSLEMPGEYALDGHDQWKVLTTPGTNTTREFIVHNCPGADDTDDTGGVIRVGRHKLLLESTLMQVKANIVQTPPPGLSKKPTAALLCSPPQPANSGGVNTWLFDVVADPRECINLATSMPALVTSMKQQLAEYRKTAVPDLSLSHGQSDPAANPKHRHDKAWGPWSARSGRCKWE